MKYNPYLIKSHIINYLDKPIEECFTYKYLESIYDEYYKSIYEDFSFNDGKIRLKLDIIENYIIYLKGKEELSLKEKNMLKNASLFYSDYIKKNPIIMVNSNIFKNLDFIGYDFIGDPEVYLEKYKKNNAIFIECYKNYMMDKNLIDKNISFIMEYLIGRIGDDSFINVHENVFNKLLNTNRNISISEKNFLLQYITYKRTSELKLPLVNVYFSKKDLYGNSKFNELGISYTYTGIIYINENIFKNNFNTIYDRVSFGTEMINTLFHEIEHYKQYAYLKEGVLNKSTFAQIKNTLFDKYLSNNRTSEYDLNYEYREIEREADINSWYLTSKLLSQYSKKKKFEEIETCFNEYSKRNMQQAYSWQKSKGLFGYKKKIINEYNNENLINIIKYNPNELKRFPHLKCFFKEDGNLHDFNELICRYTELDIINTTESRGMQDCFKEFINYYILNHSIKNHIKHFSNDELICLFDLINDNIINDLKKIEDLCMGIDDKNYEDFKFILLKLKNNVDKYIGVIEKNISLIDRLNMKINFKNYSSYKRKVVKMIGDVIDGGYYGRIIK